MKTPQIFISFFAVIVLSLGLAWISTGYESIHGWASFLSIILICGGFLLAGWRIIQSDPEVVSRSFQNTPSEDTESRKGNRTQFSLPRWLGWLLIGAVVLRLGVGVMWFILLPSFGYGSEVELSGYVMADAYNRDSAAWELAQSDKPLLAAYREYHYEDQYGGMLFSSAFVYRYLGGDDHQPLQIVILTATISSLALLFGWAFASRLWDERIAGATAVIIAFFPDAVLLGSSQMREAIMMSLAAISFYGLVRYRQDGTLPGVLWMVAPILIALPLSPLFGFLLTGMLVVFVIFVGNNTRLKDWRVWAILLGVLVLGLMVVALFGEQILPGGASNPVLLLQRWLKQAGRWQAYNAEHASGWMQKIFRATPDWTHSWLLLFYGVARPFLPAALFDSAIAIWQVIAIWRSLGWVLLLPFLIAGPLTGLRHGGWRSPVVGISILAWLGIFISSYRGGGDQWDNPRYRVTWIGLQAALAAWVWTIQRREKSPWLRRILVGMVVFLIWWIPWYLRRVTSLRWPIDDVFLTLGLGILSALLYIGFDIWYVRRRKARII